MHYFELFGIPIQLMPDQATLTKRFFELSRKYHPDYFVNDTDEAQSQALDKSSMLNKAYKTLQNPDETIKYVLQLKGLLEEEEKYELPPDFLMEMLEINEKLMDAQMDGDPELSKKVQSEIDNFQSEIYEPVKEIVENYKDGSVTKEELLQVKEYYYKKKYLQRVRMQLAGKT